MINSVSFNHSVASNCSFKPANQKVTFGSVPKTPEPATIVKEAANVIAKGNMQSLYPPIVCGVITLATLAAGAVVPILARFLK